MNASIKKRIHALVNCIQGVLGYTELGEYIKAERQSRECVRELEKLAEELKTLRAKDRNVQ